jgi:hypothetical protein
MKRPSAATGYMISLAAVVAAVLLRWLLDPFLGDHLPLVTLFGAVAPVIWLSGYGPALLAAVFHFFACAFFCPNATDAGLIVLTADEDRVPSCLTS